VHGERLPIVVFALQEDGNIGRAVRGEKIGTLVSGRQSLELSSDRRDPPRRRGEDGEGRLGRQGRLRRHPHRPGDARDVQQDRRRLLRRDDADQPAVVADGARAAHGGHQPVRQELAGAHRAGHPRLRPRRQPVQRRQHHPHRLPAAHRGAAPEFIKVARSKAEDAKVSIRNIRRKAKEELDRLAKDGETGEDEVTRAEKELEKTTAQYVTHVDELLKHKEAELLEV
jgi:ElaB/YqjD/DUF883 family membrane-anchored ribosome-binding protein